MAPALETILAGVLLVWPAFAQQSTPATRPAPDMLGAELTQKLATAKRVFVGSFGEDALSRSAQAMVVDAFRTGRRFIVTENAENADLILKGTALEKTSQELHAIGSSTAVGGAGGGHRASASGAAIGDSQASTETINDARLTVRLVSRDGDVVWSTVQESRGGKYKGAMADAAERVMKQLTRDLEKITKAGSEAK